MLADALAEAGGGEAQGNRGHFSGGFQSLGVLASAPGDKAASTCPAANWKLLSFTRPAIVFISGQSLSFPRLLLS